MVDAGGASMDPLLTAIVRDTERAVASGDVSVIARAEQRLDRALLRLPAASRMRLSVARMLAETALARHRLEPAFADLAGRAETLAALEPANPPERRQRDLTLARLRGELGLDGDDRALAGARSVLSRLSTDAAGDGPLRRDAALEWGDLAWRAGGWKEAAGAYELALDVRTAAIDKFVQRHTRELELRMASQAAPRAALAHTRAGEPWQAAETIERGRALLMNPLKINPETSDRRSDARRAIERVRASDWSLVYIVPEQETGFAIVVGRSGATTLELPLLTTAAVEHRLGNVVDVAHGRLGAGSDEWFSNLGDWLWTAAIAAVRDVVDDDRIILVACGLTSVLPLHAAWRTVAGQRRYLLEDVLIRYAPNARWACADEEEDAPTRFRSALAVGNPRNSLPPLRHAEEEIGEIPVALAPLRLSGSEASRPAVLSQWDRYDIVHFACHGSVSAEDPLQGGVMLADDRLLSVGDVIERRLESHPLVILSACETAVIGSQLPDEVVSLQSAFLAAGASGVIATLWRVDDAMSARIIGLFYEELVQGVRSPAAALRESQRRLAASDGRRTAASGRDWMPGPRGPAPTWAAFTYAGR